MKYLSLFTGIGGFELGIQQAYESNLKYALIGKESESEERPQRRVGATDKHRILLHDRDGTAPLCIGYSEIDKYATQTYEKHFPTHINFGDITKIIPTALPDFDLLVGGFPCQSFSIAGKRLGFQDTRGTLFFNIATILREKKPRLLLLENVKGLLSHENGNTFRTIIATLTELGYDLQWQVLNSKNFGVPQNRERVFIIGHLRGTPRPEVFPFGETERTTDKGFKQENSESEVASTIRSRYGNGSGSHIIGTLRTHKDGQGFREVKGGVSPTIPARAREDGSGQPVITVPVLTPDRPNKRQNGRRFKENGDPSFTLTSQDKHGIYDGMKIRRLTPTECERLQGFPDGWTSGISDTQRYKCLGNAVTVNVIRSIVERLIT